MFCCCSTPCNASIYYAVFLAPVALAPALSRARHEARLAPTTFL